MNNIYDTRRTFSNIVTILVKIKQKLFVYTKPIGQHDAEGNKFEL